MVSKIYWTLLVIIPFIVSCSTQKAVLNDIDVVSTENQALSYENPGLRTDPTLTHELLYWGSPLIGAGIGYYQNQIEFSTNRNVNKLSGALAGFTIAILTNYIVKEYLNFGYIERAQSSWNKKQTLDFMNKWLAIYETNPSDFAIAEYSPATLVILPKETESKYTVKKLRDIELFNGAFPNSNYQKSVISSSLENIGIQSVKLLKSVFNEDAFLSDQYLEICDNIQKCYDYTLIYPENYSLADNKASNLADTREEKDLYISLFFEGASRGRILKENQREDFDNCKTVFDYDKFIERYKDNDYESLLPDAKFKINNLLKHNLSISNTSIDVEAFIKKYRSVSNSDHSIIDSARVKAVNLAFQECQSVEDYENFLAEYEEKNYTPNSNIFLKAKESSILKDFDQCSTVEDFKSFVLKYKKRNTSLVEPYLQRAKIIVCNLTFAKCSSYTDFEEKVGWFYLQISYRDNEQCRTIIDSAKYIGYKLRFNNAETWQDYDAFLSRYCLDETNSYDPDKLRAKAALEKFSLKTKEEEKERKERMKYLKSLTPGTCVSGDCNWEHTVLQDDWSTGLLPSTKRTTFTRFGDFEGLVISVSQKGIVTLRVTYVTSETYSEGFEKYGRVIDNFGREGILCNGREVYENSIIHVNAFELQKCF